MFREDFLSSSATAASIREHPYPEGVKNYNKTRPINIKEFDFERKWWKKREENEYAWKIGIDDIRQRNYNLDIKSPNTVEKQNNYNSSELIELLGKSVSRSQELLGQLKVSLQLQH